MTCSGLVDVPGLSGLAEVPKTLYLVELSG